MTAAEFPEANCKFGPPAGLAESQVMVIPAYRHKVLGGSLDGEEQTIAAWRPTPDELKILNEGGLLFISMMGGLAPHYPSVDFYQATHPA